MSAVRNTSRISKRSRSSENVRCSDSKLFGQRQQIRQEDGYLRFMDFSRQIRCNKKRQELENTTNNFDSKSLAMMLWNEFYWPKNTV